MELHAPDRKGFVANAHDFAFVGLGGYLQAIGQSVALDHERMVARRGKRVRHIFEQVLFVVLNRRCFAVHHTVVDDDLGAEGVADALMPEANAKDGDLAAEMPNDIVGRSAFARRTGSGRDKDAVGFERFDAVNGDFIITMDLHGHVHLAQILNEVVGERIVVIQNQHHAGHKVERDGRIGEWHLGGVDWRYEGRVD